MVKKGKSVRAARTFVHYIKSGRITRGKPKGCFNPTKGSKIKIKGQPDVRLKICHPKPKTSKAKPRAKKGGRKTVKVKKYKYQKKVNTKRAKRTPGTSKKTVKVGKYKRKK